MKMRFTPLKSFICSLFLGFHQALACEIELVIAMDVSRSVDQYEFDLMRSGTANAFRHPEIIDMINWMDGGIAVSLTQWSGLDKQRACYLGGICKINLQSRALQLRSIR